MAAPGEPEFTAPEGEAATPSRPAPSRPSPASEPGPASEPVGDSAASTGRVWGRGVGGDSGDATTPTYRDRIARNRRGERLDHVFIAETVEPGSWVLDLGCGRGVLLKMLVDCKNVRGTGVEIAEEKVYDAVEKGLSVYHGDIDEGLSYYPDDHFDYVILSQTLQEARQTEFVMREALRVGRRLVVSFPNFGHWRARFQLLLRGRAPVTQALPYEWYETPNIHSLTLKDFRRFVDGLGMQIVAEGFIGRRGMRTFWPNLRAEHGVFVLECEDREAGCS